MNEELRARYLPSDAAAPTLSVERPTWVRYQVLAFLSAMTFILYLDRVWIGQATGDIERDLGITHKWMGVVSGAFTLAYGLFEVVTGKLGDRYGSRGVLTRVVLWWSLFTAMTGGVWAFWVLVSVRFLFGAGEAGALPNAARILRQWFPVGSRGTAQGIMTTTMMAGSAAAPVVAAYLIQVVGWRWSFAILGSVGVIWGLAFHRWFRDRPADHPDTNDAECRLIAAGQAAHDLTPHHGPIPWGQVVTSANVWLLGTIMTCCSAVFYMLITWYPTYMEQGRGASAEESGWLTSITLSGGVFGCVLGGLLTDWLMRVTGNTWRSRCGLGAAAAALAGLCVLASVGCESALLSALLAGLGLLFLYVQIPPWWAIVTKITGRHLGSLFGLMNSMGLVGGTLSPIFLGWLADTQAELGYTGRDVWDPGLYVYAVGLGLAGVLWLFVRPERPVVGPTDESHGASGDSSPV